MTVHSIHTRLDANPRAWFASPMKVLSLVLLLIRGLATPADAGGYKLENRPEVVFKGGIVHQSRTEALGLGKWCALCVAADRHHRPNIAPSSA